MREYMYKIPKHIFVITPLSIYLLCHQEVLFLGRGMESRCRMRGMKIDRNGMPRRSRCIGA